MVSFLDKKTHWPTFFQISELVSFPSYQNCINQHMQCFYDIKFEGHNGLLWHTIAQICSSTKLLIHLCLIFGFYDMPVDYC